MSIAGPVCVPAEACIARTVRNSDFPLIMRAQAANVSSFISKSQLRVSPTFSCFKSLKYGKWGWKISLKGIRPDRRVQ